MEADAVSRAGLPLLRSVVATVRRRMSDDIVFNFLFVQVFSFATYSIFIWVYCLPLYSSVLITFLLPFGF